VREVLNRGDVFVVEAHDGSCTSVRVRAGRGAGVEIVLEVDDLRDVRVGDPDGYDVRITQRS
jgi:hypothetical protein